MSSPPVRSRIDRPHARIYAHWRTIPAWFTLCPRGQAVIVAVLMSYRPDSPNAFHLTDAVAAGILGCSQNIARRVVGEVIERGWLHVERRGGFKGPKGARGRIVSLAMFETDARPPEPFRYEKWRPAEPIPNGSNSAVLVRAAVFQRGEN